ncbi:CRISPR-associated helicase, Cas3 family (plasmid) [Mycobacterium sp. JS623]|uniref:CRISPR-associated helicase/endonuclease Cas3 n=1 Tax=Mycobacterium sp. JS623 TaxID=212767 RepID=UPI0002A562FF|nr:CRISPR-associated helicase/endonuclease Cas3 [Mycobacterium sp. JS623]AGB27119.1 CRISPR-associated helicase, Cas3 family [Mycobacterium sp. JS623]
MTAVGISSLSEQVRSAWAKHRRADDCSLSLVRHCEDAAAVAAHLWDDWVPRSTREYLSAGRSIDEVRVLACWLAGVHDVGKLSPAFAIQVPSLAGKMRDCGLRMKLSVPSRQDTPHSVVSHRAIENYLMGRGWSGWTAATYAVIAGGHHGVPPSRGQLAFDEDVSHYGRAEWTIARNELLDHITAVVGAEAHLGSWAEVPMTPQQQVLWTGFVIMADWIASSDHFPLSDCRGSESTAAAAWAALGLPPRWMPSQPARVDELMRDRFDLPEGAHPNSVQRTVVDAVRSMAEPGLVVLEAPMGVGKTEAALMAAECLAARFGQGGAFLALPTMATSNAMFTRVLRWIQAQESVPVASVVLSHGKATLEDSYRGLLRTNQFHELGRDAVDDENSCRTEVIAHSWLSGRKKGLLADFAVGTIDQLLLAGLKARHLALRHLALVNKVVIVDEVHAADTYMMQYLVRVLEWLGAYRVPVVLMSATLPSSQRLALVEAYESGRGWAGCSAGLEDNVIRYPVVTVVDGQRRAVCAEWDGATTQVELERLDDDVESLIDRLKQLLDSGGCVGIVRNTVGRAQQTARLLESHFPGEVVLLHSRFVAQHRADLESILVSELGPRGNRPVRRIVVGTQVIEQSLDVDFDLLISDLAPIDLLFQRVGRLHRHPRERPGNLTTPRLILTGVQDWAADPPRPVAESARIYSEFHLLRALLVLTGRSHVTLPRDIAALVEAAYGEGLDVPASWQHQLTSAKHATDKHVANLEDRARTWRIRQPQREATLVDWLAENVGEVDDARGQAKVRDTDEGIDVILTQRIGDEVHLLQRCSGGAIATDVCPDDADARRALTGTIRLPKTLTHLGIADKTIDSLKRRMYKGWQGSKWLAGELVVELDEDLRADVMGYRIHYDDIEGLVVVGRDGAHT